MKTKLFSALLAAFCLTSTFSFAQTGENSNPYAIFGSKPYVAGTEQGKEAVKVFVIENIAEGSNVARLEHNTETGVVTSFDKEGDAVRKKKLRQGERAWPTQDRFAEKYYHLSPYSYVAGNPIRNIDINGDSINVVAIMAYDNTNGTNYLQRITSDLSAQTGLTFSVTSSGMLVYSTDSSGNAVIATDANGAQIGSATARNLMTSTIGHSQTASASIVTHRGSGGGGSQLGLNPTQVDGFVNGSVGVDNRTLGYGMSFMHELSHTTIGGGLSDSPYGAGNPGPVATRMNTVRSELNAQGGNYGQRQTYPAYPDGTGGILPFNSMSNSALQNGMTVYPTQPGAIVQHRYIKFP